jgi:hypothetical protein
VRNILLVLVIIALAAIGIWLTTTRDRPTTPDVKETAFSEPLETPIEKAPTLPTGVEINFVDVTTTAGIDFRHFDGRVDAEYLMDSTGPGAAWLDLDQDGMLDLFLVQGSACVPPEPPKSTTSRLYRNLGGGRFEDVTSSLGVGHFGFGQGATVGDIDNDGFPDLFVTCYGKPNVFYRNVSNGTGGRRFEDITESAGLSTHPDWKDRPNWSTSAAFLDFDNDGKLDLFLCSYVRIDMAKYPKCHHESIKRDGACPPYRFEGTKCILYRNLGDGKFADATVQAGVDQGNAKALGVVAIDLNDDGLIDIFVANDGVPNFLFLNRGDGRFEARGPASGCAVNGQGNPQAYMGVVGADLDGDGLPDLFSTAYHRETNSLFKNQGGGRFLDVTAGSGLGPASWNRLGFGACAVDVENDGHLDLVVTNGHVVAHIDLEGDPTNTFRQTPLLFRNDGRGRFQDVTKLAGAAMQKTYVGRGLALADYDNDGRPDLYLADSGGPSVLLHNESKSTNNWIRLQLVGTKSNRDAIGAKVTVRAGGRVLVRFREGGGSYLSAHDPRLLIGIGSATQVDSIEVRWPSGTVERLGALDAGKSYRLVEGTQRAEVVPR